MSHRPYDPDATEVTIVPGYEWPPPRHPHGRRLPRQDQFEPWATIEPDAGRSTVEIVLTTAKDTLVIITCIAILITLTWGYFTLQDIGNALKGVVGG